MKRNTLVSLLLLSLCSSLAVNPKVFAQSLSDRIEGSAELTQVETGVETQNKDLATPFADIDTTVEVEKEGENNLAEESTETDGEVTPENDTESEIEAEDSEDNLVVEDVEAENNPTAETTETDTETQQEENNSLQNTTETNTQPETIATSAVVKILNLSSGDVLDSPVTQVIVQFPQEGTLELSVNDKLVDDRSLGRTETDSEKKIITQTWYGITFREGENVLTAKVTVGDKIEETSLRLQVRGEPKILKLETEGNRVPADGRSTIVVTGKLLDNRGNVAKRKTVVTLNTSAGKFIGADLDPDTAGFQVETEDGQFTAKLRAGTTAQNVRISAQTNNNLNAYTQIQFETALRRDALLTGVIDVRIGARGTNFYDSFREFLPADRDNSTEFDVDSAVFATGSIGDWQFTGAYNSDRALNKNCDCENDLFRAGSNNDRAYPVYGDSSTSEVVTPSTDSVFVRFERTNDINGSNPDYFMWGDYNSEEFAAESQEYSAFSRQLHGFKGSYNFGDLEVTGFYANNVEGFQRDTIVPDGTSGDYFLSRRLLIGGSEEIYLEIEELDRPGTVIKRERLSRGSDYSIDYDRGTVFFTEPLFKTETDEEGNILVRRIVATYEFENDASNTSIYGGRVRYYIDRGQDTQSWVGATFIQEDKDIRDFQLLGFDTQIAFNKDLTFSAEYAESSNFVEFQGEIEGSAYRFELDGKITDGITGQAYYRHTDAGFSNNATTSFVPGQTRYGAKLKAALTSTTSLNVSYDREDNFGVAPRLIDDVTEFLDPLENAIPGNQIDNSLTTITAGITQKIDIATLAVDWVWRDRSDRVAPNFLNTTSSQLRSRFSLPITSNLSFQAINETTLSSSEDAVANDRTGMQVNWRIIDGVSLNVAQTWYTSGTYEGQSITSAGINADYKIWDDTTITGRYTILSGIDGTGGQGSIGIKQNWNIAPGLRLDFGYEYIMDDFFGRSASGSKFAQPYTFGQSASSLGFSGGSSYSVGFEYSDNPDFKVSARYQYRTSSGGSNQVITGNITGKIIPELTALVSYSQTGAANQLYEGLDDTINLKVGLAYRDPEDDSFNALLRYEYRQNPSTIPDTILNDLGRGYNAHIFSAEAIYSPSWDWEFYGKYAFRTSTTFLADDYTASSTVSLAQLRATYRFDYSWDITGEARWILQPSAGYSETGFLAEIGYYLTPQIRLSAGYAFGEIDDGDFSGSRTADGPYFGVTFKLNGLLDGFGEQDVVPPQQQESVVAGD